VPGPLATVSVGRVGTSSQALPAVLPVNFVLYDRAIFFRAVPGTKLDAAVSGVVVSVWSADDESEPSADVNSRERDNCHLVLLPLPRRPAPSTDGLAALYVGQYLSHCSAVQQSGRSPSPSLLVRGSTKRVRACTEREAPVMPQACDYRSSPPTIKGFPGTLRSGQISARELRWFL
jgi:hypothetical protein